METQVARLTAENAKLKQDNNNDDEDSSDGELTDNDVESTQEQGAKAGEFTGEKEAEN